MARTFKDIYKREAEPALEAQRDLSVLYPEPEAQPKGKVIEEINLELLVESEINHFAPIEGEVWDEFLASIKAQGILTPIKVNKRDDGKYEILAGHNRVRAARQAGLSTAPAEVLKVDEVVAAIIVADTNLQRMEVTELEKGWAYRHIFEAIAKRGKRSDLTSSQKGTKLRSDEIIAERYGIGRNTVNRKIRLTYLESAAYNMCQRLKVGLQLMEQISYLKDAEQHHILSFIEGGANITVEQLKEVRKASEEAEGSLTDKDIEKIINNGEKYPEYEREHRERRYKIPEESFPEGIQKQDREGYIIKALEYVRTNGIEL